MIQWRTISKIALAAGLGVVLIAAGCLSSGDNSAGPLEGSTVKVGVIIPLTGGGAAFGEAVKNMLDLAVNRVNTAGGANGAKLELVYEDGQCDPKTGTAAAEKLVSVNKVHVIIGGVCSGETLGAVSVTEPAKVILISPSASSPKISEAGDYVFRTYPSDNGKGTILAKYAIDKKFKKVATLAEQSDYALGIKDVFDKALKDGGVESLVETYTKESSDFRTQLLKFKSAGVEAIFLDPQTPDKGLLMLNELKEMNFHPLLLTQEVLGTDTDTLAKAKDFAEGMITADVIPPVDGIFNGIKAEYKQLYGKDVNYDAISAGAYDALMVVRDAIVAAKGDNADTMKTFLYSIQNYLGANGIFSMDKNGDPTLTHSIMVIKNGKPEVPKK